MEIESINNQLHIREKMTAYKINLTIMASLNLYLYIYTYTYIILKRKNFSTSIFHPTHLLFRCPSHERIFTFAPSFTNLRIEVQLGRLFSIFFDRHLILNICFRLKLSMSSLAFRNPFLRFSYSQNIHWDLGFGSLSVYTNHPPTQRFIVDYVYTMEYTTQ
jgi:hypothetical protein